jgi:hypothetical protein
MQRAPHTTLLLCFRATINRGGEHVGHTVTATGAISNAKMHHMKEDGQDTAKDSA